MTLHPSFRLQGTGPKGSVCLLMVQMGLGDDICALPAVVQLAREKDVTVYTRAFHKPLWESIGVNVVGVAGDEMTCDNREILTPAWDAEHLSDYETIYKISTVPWDEDVFACSGRGRIEQFAERIETTFVMKSGFFRTVLRPRTISSERYTLFAPQSDNPWRGLPEKQAHEIREKISGTVVQLGEGHVKCSTYSELVDLVWNADRIISVDNGIAHIAAALGKRLTILGGMTDVRQIFGQYEAWNPGWTFQTVQGAGAECLAPCHMQPTHGFLDGKCCGLYAAPKCLEQIDTASIVSASQCASVTPTNEFTPQGSPRL